jgi:hypothetical protein
VVASTTTDVVVPIVAASIGLVGGFATAWFTARQQRKAERRAYARERASELAVRLGGAAHAVRQAVDARARGAPAGKELDDATWLVGELSASLTQARLRLGSKSGAAAKRAVDELTRTLDLLRDESRSAEDVRSAYEQASSAEDEFVRAARDEN